MKTKKRRSAREIDEILELFGKSGQTQEKFAKQHKLNVGTLRSWIYKRPKGTLEDLPSDNVQFVEVKLGEDELCNRGVVVQVGHEVRVCFETLPSADYLADFVRDLC